MPKSKITSGIFAPSYYGEFKCIADKCKHSCCIDWEICIDDVTYAKYKDKKDILATVKECEDGACFALQNDGRCPHLNADGLCDIIISHGEEYLCDICQNHPRFFNRINGGRTEAGLGIVCEEACRLILENDKPFALSQIEELDGEENCCGERDFDALPIRDFIISVIEAEGDFDEKLVALKAEFKLPEPCTAEQWLERFLALEILDAQWEQDLKSMRGKFLKTSLDRTRKWEKYYKQLLIYFVYRHVSTAENEINLAAKLAFCILSVQVIRSLFETDTDKSLASLIDCARRYSAEIEYSEDNTDEIVFAFESCIVS